MEAWPWIVVIVALLLLVAGTLRFDLLSAAHGHGAAAHTGHVASHGPGRRRQATQRHDKRDRPA